MSYLIDTDWIADYLSGDRGAIALINALADDPLAISLITFGEVDEGIYYGDDPAANEAGSLGLLRVVHVIQLDEDVMRRFARMRGALRRHGMKLGDPDILIGATALHYGLTLVTRNQRHFRRIPGLKLYEPA